MLRFATVEEVSTYRGSDELADVLRQLQHFSASAAAASANVLAKNDPEYQFVLQCGTVCVTIEQEKTKILRFVTDHYSRRFPELAVLLQDGMTLCSAIALLGNDIHGTDRCVSELEELVPSQLLAAVIAAACTTRGAELPAGDMENIVAACNEYTSLEEVKQVLLEYIQERIILLCRNTCALVGCGIASQLVAVAGSVDRLAEMDANEVMELGSYRANKIGFAVKTAGFLQNVDLVQKQPPELRTRALRLVADRVVSTARIDANRPGADESEGLKARAFCIRRILSWTDPFIQEAQRKKYGLSNKLYEKRSRLTAQDRRYRDLAAARDAGSSTLSGSKALRRDRET
jgi:U4/U6 small nuclear ribonucleoprotein PRP31